MSSVYIVRNNDQVCVCVCVCVTGDSDYSSVLLGMLVMQDVQLGLFIAVMPTLIQTQSGDTGRSVSSPLIAHLHNTHTHARTHTQLCKPIVASALHHSLLFEGLRVLYLLLQVLVSLAAVLLLCLLLKKFVIGPYYKKLHAESKGNKEILVLGMAAFVFFMLTV